MKDITTGLTLLAGATALVGGTALLAVPKWVAFREALAKTSFASLNMGMGRLIGWGAALAAATIVVSAFARASDEAAIGQAELVNLLTTSTDATKALDAAASQRTGWSHFVAQSESVKSSLADLPRLMESVKLGGNDIFGNFFSGRTWGDNASIEALNTLREMGKAWAEIASTDLGRAQRQFGALVAEQKLSEEQTRILLDQMPELRDEFMRQAGEQGIATDTAEFYNFVMKESAPAVAAAAAAAEVAASDLFAMSEGAQAAWKEVDSLVASLNYFNSVGQDAERANLRYQETLAEVAEYVKNAQAGVEGFSTSVDRSTVAGAKNRDMFAGMAADSQAVAKTMFEQEVATLGAEQASANYFQKLAEGRQGLYDTIFALTGSAEAAQELTDAVYEIPTDIEITAMANTYQAELDLQNLARERTATIRVATWYDRDGNERVDNWAFTPASANGNLFEFANGGGLDTGIYRGGAPITRFAELETGWESFISGKPSERDRNRQIWVETGNRLDVFRDLEERIVKALGGAGGGVQIGSISLGAGVERQDFRELEDTMDRISRRPGNV